MFQISEISAEKCYEYNIWSKITRNLVIVEI